MANDLLLTSITPISDIGTTTTGDWVYVGAYRDVRSRVIVGGDVSGTDPTLIVTVEGSSDGAGAADATLATHATIIDEMVGYIDAGDSSPQHAVPGEAVPVISFNTAAYKWVRHVATIGGTDTPTFNDVTCDFEPLSGALQRSGTL